MTDINTLRYSITLPNGEDLVLSMAFNAKQETEDIFLMRCRYMFQTMQQAWVNYDANLLPRLPKIN